jgi:hypothetical protein
MKIRIAILAACVITLVLAKADIVQARCKIISDCGCHKCPPDIETHTCYWLMGNRLCDSLEAEQRVGPRGHVSSDTKTRRVAPTNMR